MQVTTIYSCRVFVLRSTKPQKFHLKETHNKSLCENWSSKNLVAQFKMLRWFPWWMMGGGPHEWSHDASVVACMYPNATEQPLATCYVAITVIWQPLPITIDMYYYPRTHYNRCLSYIWSSRVWTLPTYTTCKQMSNVIVLGSRRIGYWACFKKYWVGQC